MPYCSVCSWRWSHGGAPLNCGGCNATPPYNRTLNQLDLIEDLPAQ